MADINEILGRQINSVKKLKSAIKELQDSLVGVDAESEEFKTTSQQLAAAQDELNKVTRAGKDENIAAKDSLVGMRQEYKALYDQYKLLSDEQRKNPIGKEMAANLEALSDKINETQKGIGDYRGNVGRYAESVIDAFNKMGVSLGGLKGPLQIAANGSKTLGKIWKDLAKHPLLLILTGLVALFMKVAGAIKKNEELTDRLKQAMSAFQPVLNFISNAFDWLAEKLVKVVEGFTKVSEKVLNLIPGYEKLSKKTKQLAKDQDELNKKMREGEVAISEKEKDVALLRDEASVEDDLVKKKQKLEEAQRLENEAYADKIALEEENLRIMKENAELTANSKEDNNKIAAQEATINRLYREQALAMKRANKELKSLTNSREEGSNAASSSIKEEREEVEKLARELDEFYKTDEQKLTERYERELKEFKRFHRDTTNLTKKYNQDMAALQKERRDKEREAQETEKKVSRDIQKRLMEQDISGYLFRSVGETKYIDRTISEVKALDEAVRKLVGELKRNEDDVLVATTEIGNMFLNIFENVDMGEIRDKDGVISTLTALVKSIPEDLREPLTKAIDELGKITYEDWDKMVTDIQDKVLDLREIFGLDIFNWGDIENTLVVLRKNKLEKELETVDSILDEWAFKENEEIIKAIKGVIHDWSKVMKDEMEGGLDFSNVLARTLAEAESRQSTYLENVAQHEWGALEAQKKYLEQQIRMSEEYSKKREELELRYAEVVKQMQERINAFRELHRERTAEMIEALIDLTDRLGSAMSTYRSAQEQMIESQLKAGEIDEAEAKKRKKRLLDLQKVETGFNIATIVADAASGLFSIWKGYAMEVGTINPQTAAATGPAAAGTLAGLNTKSLITAIAKSAGLAATATAQVAAARGGYITAKNNLAAETSGGGSGGSGSGVASTPYLIDSQPFTYSRTLQTEQEEEMNNRPVWVSVVDVENALGQQAVVKQESSW